MVPGDLLTIAGAAIVVTILFEVIVKRALAFSEAQVSRFGPLIAILMGIVIAGGTAVYVGDNLVAAGLTGLLAGASSMGLYDGFSSARPGP